MSVPNVSEGRDPATLEAIGRAFAAAPGVRLLDRHADADHHRAVFTLAGPPGQLALALLEGARATVELIDLRTPRGLHPHVGALDVVPLVYLNQSLRGAAVVEALLTADLLACALRLPVFLYGALAEGRARSEIRRGGAAELARRISSGELAPDFGPTRMHPSAGAVLVGARPPLVAFNLELEPPADRDTARKIAAAIREGGAEGLPGVRAIGLALDSRAGRAQVSVNVEDVAAVPLAAIVTAVARHATPTAAELVGLAPRIAFAGFPDDLPISGFDPARHVIENLLRIADPAGPTLDTGAPAGAHTARPA